MKSKLTCPLCGKLLDFEQETPDGREVQGRVTIACNNFDCPNMHIGEGYSERQALADMRVQLAAKGKL